MPFTFTNFNLFPKTIPDATPLNDGVMTAAQAAKLAGLTPGGSKAFKYTVSQPADGSDWIVTMPAAVVQATANYMVTAQLGTVDEFTATTIDSTSFTVNTFRVQTDAELPNGTIIFFSVEQLA